VCRFHVAAGAKLRPRRGAIYKLSGAVAKPASINLRKLVLSPTGSINLGFISREDLLMCSSFLPLGISNWADIYTPSELHKMAQNFGMTATYGQHKDKTGSATVPTTKQLEENPIELEAKKLRLQSSDPKDATTQEAGTPTI
jgi:hypothetical protein